MEPTLKFNGNKNMIKRTTIRVLYTLGLPIDIFFIPICLFNLLDCTAHYG